VRLLRKLAFVLVALAAVCASRAASANEGTTGYSGKPYNGVTDTCKTLCHVGGGAVPTVNITVPAAMKAGDTAEVTIVVTGTRTRTSMNAALSDGVKATKGQNTEIPFPVETPGEVAAVAPPPNGQNGTYKFTFVAPQKNGPIMLWVAAMSANGSGTTGDGVTTTTRTITISGATPPSTDAGTTADGGVISPPSDAGATSKDGGGSSSTDGGGADDNENEEGAGNGRRVPTGDEPSGCTGAPRSSTTPLTALGATAVVALLARLRRRRR
jgi:hypothetical protein